MQRKEKRGYWVKKKNQTHQHTPDKITRIFVTLILFLFFCEFICEFIIFYCLLFTSCICHFLSLAFGHVSFFVSWVFFVLVYRYWVIEVQRGDYYSVRCLYGARTVSDRGKTETVKCLGASCAVGAASPKSLHNFCLCLQVRQKSWMPSMSASFLPLFFKDAGFNFLQGSCPCFKNCGLLQQRHTVGKELKTSFFREKWLGEVTVVVLDYIKKQKQHFGHGVAPTGGKNAPISQCHFVYTLPVAMVTRSL